MKMTSYGWDSIFIFCLALMIFTIHLSPELTAFETRFGLFAQQMFYHGVSWFPMTYRGPYPDYPILPTLLIHGISLLFGKVSVFTAVLPTAIASALILVFIYLLGRCRSRAFGIYGVLLAFLCQLFFDKSRSISLDQYVSLVTVAAFYVVYTAEQRNDAKRLWWIPLLLVLGFAFRGPIGFLIPFGIVASFYVLCARYRMLTLLILTGLFLFLCCIVFLLLLAYWQGGHDFVSQVIHFQALGRLQGKSSYWHYVYYFHQSLGSFAVTYPFALLVIFFNAKAIMFPKNENERLLQLLTVWFLIVLIGFSIPTAQNSRYLLPMVPAMVLIAAYPLANKESSADILSRLMLLVFKLFPVLLLVLSVVLLIAFRRWADVLSERLFLVVLFSIVLSLISWLWLPRVKRKNRRNFGLVLVAVVTLIVFNLGILNPVNYAIEKTTPFVKAVEAIQSNQPGPFAFYKIGPDAEDVKFMVNYPRLITPIFVTSEAALSTYPRPTYFITTREEFGKIQSSGKYLLLYDGHIGHRPCVVFTVYIPRAR